VQDIVVWHEVHGLSPDEIVSQFPGLTLADVYAALTYYHDHREEIHQHMRERKRSSRRSNSAIPPKSWTSMRRLRAYTLRGDPGGQGHYSFDEEA
jgi:hypothetical protein